MSNQQPSAVFQAFQSVSPATAGTTGLNDLIRELLPGGGEGLPAALNEASKQIDALRGASTTQTEAVVTNTDAVSQNTVAKSTGSGAGIASSIGKTVWDIFGGGLSASPIVSLVTGLFGGGGASAQPAPLTPTALPPSIQFANFDYGQGGLPRSTAAPEPRSAAQPMQPAQITVQVQAMDSRSFLDHSQEIAQAVRLAMLHSHAVNDLVNEL